MLTIACCILVGLGIDRVSIQFSVWSVSGYAHVFALLSLCHCTVPQVPASESGSVKASAQRNVTETINSFETVSRPF